MTLAYVNPKNSAVHVLLVRTLTLSSMNNATPVLSVKFVGLRFVLFAVVLPRSLPLKYVNLSKVVSRCKVSSVN